MIEKLGKDQKRSEAGATYPFIFRVQHFQNFGENNNRPVEKRGDNKIQNLSRPPHFASFGAKIKLVDIERQQEVRQSAY